MKRLVLFASAALAMSVYGAAVTVVAPQDGAAKSVTVGGKPSVTYDKGKSAALKATAADGWAFAGWYTGYDAASGEFSDEAELENSADWRTASANYVVGDEDVTLYARFTRPADDSLSFDLEAQVAGFAYDFDDADRPVLSMTNSLDSAVWIDSVSQPTVSVSGLPAGLRFDAKSFLLSGTPTTPGVYRVYASAKNASGYSFGQIFYVRVENVSTEHVYGMDNGDVTVGEEVESYLEDYFYISNTNSEVRSVGVSGLPQGLSLETESYEGTTEYYVRGTPSSSGDYVVWCNVTFEDGTSEVASMLFTVNEPSPFDYPGLVDFDLLNGYFVGDAILSEDFVSIGEFDEESGTGITSVTGLPTGISCVKAKADGGFVYVLQGVFAKAGEYAVAVKVAYEDWESDSIKTVVLTRKVIVGDRPGVYVSAAVFDPESAPLCKVSGGGVYAPGSTAKLTATAGNGFVFAGWFDFAGSPLATGTGDYRATPATVVVREESALEWYAAFVPKGEDAVDLSDLDGAELTIDTMSGDTAELSFAVVSGSMPTLKFANLPAGVVCVPSADVPGDYVLRFDPATSAKTPAPGRYRVTVTATNVSRASDAAQFTITVLNLVDDDIHVENDYGVLTPNVAMTPISLSDAVDFAGGATLAVTGLPAGLKYNDKSAPLSISGTPTKPGDYTLTFTAKVDGRTAVATAFIRVKDFPTVVVNIDGAAAEAGNKVSGAGSFKAGSKTTLKATAAKGWVFAGWGAGSGVEGLAALNPSLAYVLGSDDLYEVAATFIELRDDYLYVEDPDVVSVVRGAAFSTNLVETIVETRSLPTVSVSGLPNGIKYDAKTFMLSGTVGKTAKAGYCYATLTAKNAGGYTFSRILKFVVLESAGEDIPDEPELPNGANIDFSALDGLATGDFLPAAGVEAVGFAVEPSTNTEGGVASVAVTGLPAGLKSSVVVEDGIADVVVYGTPTKPGRYALKVAVSYADKKKATSEYALMVEDGGSAWLDVTSFDGRLGTVSGSGVYSSGATVKISAKPGSGNVFSGWYEDEDMPFNVLAEMDGIDYRAASVSFVFRSGMFANDPPVLIGDFVAKADDTISIEGLDETWEIVPTEDGEQPFTVSSASLPKLTASGLPKGVTLDAAGGKFVYSSASADKVVPGWYTVTLKASNQSNASTSGTLSVFVANKTTDVISGLDPAADAYPLYAGVTLDPELIAPEVDAAAGWKLAATGLPAGLKFVQDKSTGAYSVTGVPTKAGSFTVTFTATLGRDKEVATVTMSVAAMPEWAVGTFDGVLFDVVDDVTNAVGQVTATVSAAGKVSGKVLKGGKSYSFAAAAFGDYDAGSSNFTALVEVPWSKTDSEEFLLAVGVGDNGVGVATMEPTGDGAAFAEAVQNVWLRKDLSAPAFATGKKQPVLAISSGLCCGLGVPYDLTCKFGAKGVVTINGKVDGNTASGKAQTLLVDVREDGGYDARVVIYVANAKLEGGAFCEAVDVVLSDTDGDGKLDHAGQP